MFELIPIFGMVTSSAVVVLVVWLVTHSRQRRVEAQVQMQSKLIERFGTAPELIQFLHSPAGRQFVAGVQGAPIALSRERIMAGFTRSILMTSVGVAFVVIAVLDREDDWLIPASIVFSLSLGYLLATYVTYRFSKSIARDEAMPVLTSDQPSA